jgi:CCR4-NOT transcription complex subunit 1
MRIAARNMVANISSGMMLITGKEPLTSHLFNALKTQSVLANAYIDLIIQACSMLVQDNIELCMCFLQKIAIQRSIMELERKLQQEFETRQRSKVDGRLHYDPNVFAYHTEKMPEMIRLRVGSISPQQFSVYEEFGINLPGFKINVDERAAAAQQSNFNQIVDDMNSSYENIILTLQKEFPTYSMPAGHFLIVNSQGLIHAIHDF